MSLRNTKENYQYNKEDYDRFFKKKDQSNKYNKPSIVVPVFNVEQQHFPVLTNISNKKNDYSNNHEETPSFAKMASLPKIIETVIEEAKPGHVDIRYEKNKIKMAYGQKTTPFILYEAQEDMKDTLHFRMNRAIDAINKKQQQRIAYYNEVHGEGAYEDMFYRDVYTSGDESDDDIMSDDYEDDFETN